MKWNKDIIEKMEYGEIKNLEEKRNIAKKIASYVKDGQTIGFGSGSTSYLAVIEISKRIQEEGLKIKAIPTSHEIELLCAYLNIPTTTLVEEKPDWSFDGADEVNKNNWLIKGRGAAMFREKLNIANSSITYILVDESKFVNNLCDNFPIPVECYPASINFVKEELLKLGAEEIILRTGKGKDGPIITENNNIILDVKFDNVNENLEKELKQIVGVIETGLFIGYNIEILK